jgi:hypothetical protein
MTQKAKIDIQKIEKLYPKISSFYSRIEGVLNETLVKEIQEIQETFKSVFAEKWEQEELDFHKNYEALEKIATQQKFQSIWSISEISAKDLNSPFSKNKVKSLVYLDQKIEINAKVSWLDMWRYADQIIRMSGDNHHIFIECFDKTSSKSANEYRLITGS